MIRESKTPGMIPAISELQSQKLLFAGWSNFVESCSATRSRITAAIYSFRAVSTFSDTVKGARVANFCNR
jgi:hypothetical protein